MPVNWSLLYAIGVWINIPMTIGIAVLNFRIGKIQRDLRDNDQKMFERWSDLSVRLSALESEANLNRDGLPPLGPKGW